MNIEINSKKADLKELIERLIIKDKDDNKEDFSFELKAKSDKEWELIGDKITLSLNKKR